MQLIVAEKPSVARDLARVLGVRPSGEHCFEGDGRVITWCIGHLVELDEPASYDGRWKAWRLDTLPMLPDEFRLRAAKHARAQLRAVSQLLRDRRFASVVNACDAGREGELIFRYVYQYARGRPPVQRLWISSLTDDAIRRGFAALRPGARFDALADAARSRSEADWLVGMNATRAITVRGREAGHDALYSIGRVQTPTLAMLVERERAIATFVPRPYWEIRGDFTTADGAKLSAGWRYDKASRLAGAALADAIVARDAAHAAAADPAGPRVESVRAKTVREPPPLLFDLTSLQRTANRRFGYSAARTLEIAQALYERHKLLTYPRTDSRHLTSDVVGELPALFAALAGVPDYAPFASALVANAPRPGRRIVDDAKVHDHHAIIPTSRSDPEPRLDALDRDERRLYDLVARRFLGAFFPDAELAVTEVWIRVGAPRGSATPLGETGSDAGGSSDRSASSAPATAKVGLAGSSAAPSTSDRSASRSSAASPDAGASASNRTASQSGASSPARAAADAEAPALDILPPMPDRFLARGRVRVVAGWQAVAGIDGSRDATGEPASLLPPLVEGQALDGAFAVVAKQTTPPPRYTEATLLGAMESAGKQIDDEALRQAMRDCGLGTPATRAAIIETLLQRGYIERAKQHLAPTPLGAALITALPVASLASPELTGTWEARLARIARGEDTRAAFMADIARYVAETVAAIRAANPPAAPPNGAATQPRPWQRRGRKSGFRKRGARRDTAFARASTTRQRAAPPGAVSFDARASKAPASPGRAATRSVAEDRSTAAPPGADGPVPSSHARARRTSASADGPPPPSPTRAKGTGGRGSRPGAAESARRARRPAPIGSAVDLTCPRCGGTLITGARGWGCSRWRDGCRFVVWFQFAGRRLTKSQLRDLVTRGKTRKATYGATAGRLVLDGDVVRLEPG